MGQRVPVYRISCSGEYGTPKSRCKSWNTKCKPIPFIPRRRQKFKSLTNMDSLACNDEVVVGRKGIVTIDAGVSGAMATDTFEGIVSEAIDDCNAIYCPEYFAEKESVIHAVHEIVTIYSTDGGKGIPRVRSSARSLMHILEQYREDSSLLDPHIGAILKPIFSEVLLPHMERTDRAWTQFLSMMCSLVYLVSSICGYKALTTNEIFPHQVSLLNPVLTALEQLRDRADQWESKFVLFLWLSVLVMVPFDFAAIGIEGLSDRLCAAGIEGLSSRDSNRALTKASSWYIARLFSRNDAVSASLFDKYNEHTLSASRAGPAVALLEGVSRTLSVIPRSRISRASALQLLSHIQTIHPTTVRENKLVITIAASLAAVLNDEDSLNHAETCIELILSTPFLESKDGSVRSAVAKAITRVSLSLPSGYAAQLVEYLVNIDPASDYEEHSACLVLGELARRGLVGANPRVVAATIAALETERSSGPLTQQIRDAGCAIVWSLSRSVDPDKLLQDLLIPVLPSLVNIALFERDINLRRSAAAAIQELIGRTGTRRFPSGLGIVNIIEFWSVASISSCYTELPRKLLVEAGEWGPRLRDSMMKHLMEAKLLNSHQSARSVPNILLAAEGVGRLFTSLPDADSKCVLIRLLTTTAIDTQEWTHRIGAIHAIKAILAHSTTECLDEPSQSSIRNLVPLIEKKRLYRGKGGDLIRVAAYQLVGQIYVCHKHGSIKFKDGSKFLAKMVNDVLKEGIVHLCGQVQSAAIVALRRVWLSMQRTDDEVAFVKRSIVDDYVAKLTEDTNLNVAARKGMIIALAVFATEPEFPPEALTQIRTLFVKEATSWPVHHLGSHELVDPNARRMALFGLIRITSHSGCTKEIVDTLLIAINDFQTDKRGDVGSWVRAVAVDGIALLLERPDCPFREELELAIIAHASERLDRIRDRCADVLVRLANGRSTEAGIRGLFASLTGIAVRDIIDLQFDRACDPVPLGHTSELLNVFKQNASFVEICHVVGISEDPQRIAFLLSQYINCTGGLTAQSVSASAERALIALCETPIGETVLIALLELAKAVVRSSGPDGVRFQSKQDRVSRFFIPAINTVHVLAAGIPGLLSEPQAVQFLIDVVEPSLTAIPCQSILSVNRLRAVSKLYSLFALNNLTVMTFLLEKVVMSNVPVLRHAFAMDILAQLTASGANDDLIDIVDDANWLSEEVVSWIDAARAVASAAGVADQEIDWVLSTSGPSAELKCKVDKTGGTPAYAELVNEMHRFR